MTAEILERIRALELDVVGRVEGLLQGDHRGLLPGPGGEAGDARPYVAGDDVRRIDWNVTARAQEPHVRDTTADHELETTLLIDATGSMRFGSERVEKWEVAMAAAAVFGFLTDRAGDRVGASIVGDDQAAIPARPGRAHVYSILQAYEQAVMDSGAGDLAAAIERTRRLRRRRGFVAVISDFRDGTDWWRPLRALAVAHDVVAVEVFDERERRLPAVGMVRMVDPETGTRMWVDTSSGRFRRSFEQKAAALADEVASEISQCGVTHIPLSTGEDWVGQLVSAVSSRRRLLAEAGRSR